MQSTDRGSRQKKDDARRKIWKHSLFRYAERLVYYREFVAPRSAPIEDIYERSDFEELTMAEEYDLPNAEPQMKQFALDEIAQWKKDYEKRKASAERHRLYKASWLELKDARRSGDADRIEKAQARHAKFMAKSLSELSGETYPTNISWEEINQASDEWRKSQNIAQRKETFPKRIALTSVLVVAVAGLGFWLYRRAKRNAI